MLALVDADDTIWFDEVYFRRVVSEFYARLPARQRVAAELHMAELLQHAGPGESGFSAAIRACAERLGVDDAIRLALDGDLDAFARRTIRVLTSAADVLAALAQTLPVTLYTKGVLQEQERKLACSGLAPYFSEIIIVDRKDVTTLAATLSNRHWNAANVVAIGNSVRHDIAPACALGAKAIWLNHRLNLRGRNAPLPEGVPTCRTWTSVARAFERLRS